MTSIKVKVSADKIDELNNYITTETVDIPPFCVTAKLSKRLIAYLQCDIPNAKTSPDELQTNVVVCDAFGIEHDCKFIPPKTGKFEGQWAISVDDLVYNVDVIKS